ncbi:GNAT family N-acetyltransferase [Streptomyces sp. NBC_01465]|uniref:GNAT family N-acetyltransferase n=1 Tax=Streptomyces sp. NBC_01465 TaxID=2903878 RepID=UPI002E330CFA|nr:GNAT family N-acetyltransferase [Streptomyces sp. NBC_01465]
MTRRSEIVLPPYVRLSGEGIELREWTEDDLSSLVELYDDPEIDRWTPVPSPFDAEAARAYLAKARAGRDEGRSTVQLAITSDGKLPQGEVLLFRSALDGRELELAYGVGRLHRRQGLAARSVALVTEYAAHRLGARRVLLRIESENAPSVAVARAAGFRLTDDEPVAREAKGRQVLLHTWSYG